MRSDKDNAVKYFTDLKLYMVIQLENHSDSGKAIFCAVKHNVAVRENLFHLSL